MATTNHLAAWPTAPDPARLERYVEIARAVALDEPRAALDLVACLDEPPDRVADTLRFHHLLGLVRRAAADAGDADPLSSALHDALASRAPIQRLSPQALMQGFEEVRDLLAEARIPVLLLKGLTFALRLYGGLDRRPQFDLDVLVPPRAARRAVAVLRRAGFHATDHDLHARTLVRGDLKVDVHHHLRWAPAYRLDPAGIWGNAVTVTIAGREVPTLADGHVLVLASLGLFEDLGQGMARLKQLVDLTRLLRELDATFDWQRFFTERARENLLAPCVNVLWAGLELMAARDIAPRLGAALSPHASLVRHRDRDELLALLGGPRKAASNLAWFARVYPGSLTHYLAWFWLGGFPANLRHLGRPWVRDALRLALAPAGRGSP